MGDKAKTVYRVSPGKQKWFASWPCPQCGRWRSRFTDNQNPIRVPNKPCASCLAGDDKPPTDLSDRASLPDIRHATDREGAFKHGWTDAVTMGKDYDTSREYTAWQNLGCRIGREVGPAPPELRDRVYDALEAILHWQRQHGIYVNPADETSEL